MQYGILSANFIVTGTTSSYGTACNAMPFTVAAAGIAYPANRDIQLEAPCT